ncbi:MAG TPA: efflux RND transporter periplasmic adaptor subunit [Anaeromyxobacter sp.]|nr:efflux RND transporter periplasmic adaptor subunit [Anaeromyxobacter sp.]
MSEPSDVQTSTEPGHEPLPEGEERPPPGTRTAAIVRWSLVGLMAVAAAGAWIHHVATGGIVDVARTRYRCPMHPTVVMEQKGECPICGMDLVAATDADEHAAHERQETPAREAGEHGGMAGAAPAAGPQAATPIPMAHGTLPRAEYTCPMHPAFVTDDPKVRCPECGMKLVPKNADAAPEHAAIAAEGVPGLKPVELSVDRIQLIGMKTAVAMREPLAASIRTVGFVTASEKGVVSVNARFSGWIESLGAGDTGQFVEKGAVLATLYSPDAIGAQQQFLAAARWAEGKPATPPGSPAVPADSYGRDNRQRLVLLGFASEDIDAIAAAGVPSQTVNLRAPVRGYIAKKAALRGVYVQPGTELFQIADLSTVWLIADVYETEIGRVKVGQKAVLELPAYPGERFAGKVTFIYPALAAGSRTLQARIEFRNSGLKLRPGMYGDVTLDLGDQHAIVVPAEALVDTGEIQYVFVSKGGGRFEPRRVRAGWSGGGRVAVLEGLAEGERVVTTANFLLDSESRLRAAIEGFGAGAGH